MASRVTSALLDALAVLSPVDCAGCGTADRSLCDECRAALVPAVTPRTLADGSTVYTGLRYEGVVRRTLLALKESGRTDVARPLGLSFAAVLTRVAQPGAEFLAVPTSRAAWRRRGYDPVVLLCKRSGFEQVKILRRTRVTASQKTLGSEDRVLNLQDSMIARSSLRGRRFILIDDVVTTGSTLSEAARAVADAGGEVVGRAALAFTPRIFSH
jgi:ComF family protein